ncbi:MAG: AAA family ATPase [Candidatus Aenigmatarchaeota archaeon]|nr:MAG: AAA family ATPase [Candidatus Aenigmarchaeota archaeon]
MGVELTVAEALQMDVGRGIARIDTRSMEKLGIEAGQPVLIKGKRETVAIVWRARPEDNGLNLIRIDGVTRHNAQVSLGDTVVVEKVDAKPAKVLTIAPTEEIRFSGDPSSFFKERLLNRVFMKGDRIEVDILGTSLDFVVTNTNPKGPVMLTEHTQLIVSERVVKEEETRRPKVTYEDIGGLKEEIAKIREMVELPLKHPEVFTKLGISAPKGVLLYGPPGTGKTLLAKAVANETNANFYAINGPEIMSKWYGESEKQLRDIFDDAEKNAPSIIFIDEIDAIAPKRDEVSGEVERRVVAQLLTLMDGLKGRGEVVVIGATNRPSALDPALRRPGRFDREIEIGVPNIEGRKEILEIHTRGMPLDKDVDLNRLAEITHGYTGADIEILCKEAAMKALRRYLPEIQKLETERVPPEILEKMKVTMKDFTEALKIVQPSAMREVLIRKPNVKWDDIGDLETAKQELMEAVVWPMKYPEMFETAGIRSPKGILLYGPPGCGKTLLAKAVATETDANFIAIKGPELLSKWVGESEKKVREIFSKARQVAPCVIFFDEIDSIAQIRGKGVSTDVTDRILNQLLTELDGIETLEDVVFIAATNRKDLLDPALLRPGRIDREIEVPMPDEKGRLEIFKVHTKNMPLGKHVSLEELAKKTDDMTGADIEAICVEAGMLAIREAISKGEKRLKSINKKHFEQALEKVKSKKTGS